MKIGFVGLGKMGGKMVERLLNHGHEVVVYNLTSKEVDEAVSKGAVAAKDLTDLVGKLDGRKLVWLMVPAGKPVEENIAELVSLLGKDGGKLKGVCDYEFIIQAKTSDRVQEVHMMILHIIIEGVERILFPENYLD